MAGVPINVRNFQSVLRAEGFSFRHGRRLFGIKVINKTGSDIAANKLVAISGYDVTSKRLKIVLADADAADLGTDVYVSLSKIANGKEGNVYKGGLSTANLDTSGATTVGDPVYLSTTAGAFTSTAPTAANSRQQIVGYSTVKSSTVGQLQWDIKPVSVIGTLDSQGYATGRLTAQAATSGTVATFTPVADGSFDVCANILVTTATTHTFNMLCTYTDEGNTARSTILPFRNVGSTTALVSSITNATGAVPYMGVPVRIRAKAATAITLLTDSAGTYTTVVYNVEGTIKQVA